MKKCAVYQVLFAISILVSFLISSIWPDTFNPIWMAVLMGAALTYGIVGPSLSARNLFFLAGSIPHSALLATSLGLYLSLATKGGYLIWSILSNIVLIFIVGYIIHKGADPNKITSIFIGTTASLTVVVIYYVTNHFYVMRDIESLLVGDPLLSTAQDAAITLLIFVVTALYFLLTYRENIYIGIMGIEARLAGLKVYLYDLLFYTILAVSSVSLMKEVGFILTHVYILIPSAVSSIFAKSSKEAAYLSLTISSYSALLGLALGIILNLSPSGATGLIMIFIYAIVYIFSRRRRA